MKKFFKIFNTILAYIAGFAVALISLDYLYFIFIYKKPINCLECLEKGDFVGLTSGSLPILIIAILFLIIYFSKLRKIAS
jgi:hypothetical protein